MPPTEKGNTSFETTSGYNHPKVAGAKEKTKSGSSQQQSTLLSCGFLSPPTKMCLTEPTSLQKWVLSLSCSHHILSRQFFEDPIISQCFCLTSFISQDIQSELRKMAVEIKSGLMNEHRGGWTLIVLMDGKTH
jgi:hypothetical protein